MPKITEEQIQNIITNTRIIRDNLKRCEIYDYTELHFCVLGKTPFRDDMCICRNGSLVVSPQLLFTPNNFNYSLDDLAEEDNSVIEARILFLNNYKLQFSEHPVQRYKKSLNDVAEEVSNNFELNESASTWAVIETPNVNLWRLSLMHYISLRSFIRKQGGGNNRLSNFFN